MPVSRETRLLPSVFDRLADLSTDGIESDQWYDIDRLTRAVRRDLEDLLNTQRTVPGLATEFPTLAESVVGFGVPDPSTFSLETPAGRRQFAAALVHTIHTFEPRLRDVRIELGGNTGEKFRDLRFRVVARLAAEPAPRIIFESELHIPSGQFSVGEASE